MKKLLAVLIVLGISVSGCANVNDDSTMPAVQRNNVGSSATKYVVPEQGDINTAIDPQEILATDDFTATRGYFVATNSDISRAPRFYGVIPAGWETISVKRPPPGTVGVISPSAIETSGYRPNVMIGLSTTTQKNVEEVLDTGLDSHSVPGATWLLQKEGKNKHGVKSRLYKGDWSIRGVDITGYGYVSSLHHNNETYIFTVIMAADSSHIGVDEDRWEFQINTILNSLDVIIP